jgi:hypothetical protein
MPVAVALQWGADTEDASAPLSPAVELPPQAATAAVTRRSKKVGGRMLMERSWEVFG